MTYAVIVRAALASIALLTAAPQASSTAGTSQSRASRADSVLEARASAVSATLRCPVCQGESIADSPSELAQQMRAVVRDRLRAGETPDQVRAYFVSRYGEWILLEPKVSSNIMLYALPVILVVGGLSLVFFLVRRWTGQAAPDVDDGLGPHARDAVRDVER